LPARELWDLIAHLPPGESALWRAANPERARDGWRTSDDLLALIAELLDRQYRQYVAFETGGKSKMQPLEIPRPGAPKKKAAGAKAFLNFIRNLK
jgi:hypothetical protein